MSATYPSATFENNLTLPTEFQCDSNRIGQLYSNLLTNAVVYGADATPITTSAVLDDQVFTLITLTIPATR